MKTRSAWASLIIGAVIAIAGVALISIPFAIILAGVGIASLGLLVIEVSP